MNQQKMNYHDVLKDKIEFILTYDLIIERNNKGLIPFTSEQIITFIQENEANIEIAIDCLICGYDGENAIELLADPLLDWDCIREYLYELIDITKKN